MFLLNRKTRRRLRKALLADTDLLEILIVSLNFCWGIQAGLAINKSIIDAPLWIAFNPIPAPFWMLLFLCTGTFSAYGLMTGKFRVISTRLNASYWTFCLAVILTSANFMAGVSLIPIVIAKWWVSIRVSMRHEESNK